MRRQVETFPALDQPLLVMGMPPAPFLLVTVIAILVPVLTGFHPVALAFTTLYPAVLSLLRRIGRQDPQRFHLLLEHVVIFNRFYHPVGFIAAPRARYIRRRNLLP